MDSQVPGAPASKNWWDRNWKWVVPGGCLTLLILAGASAFALFTLISAGMKSSAAYSDGMERARTDCEVQEALGNPITPGWLISGSINVAGPSGHAELSIPLRGSRHAGTLYVTATKSAGEWRFDLLKVEVEGQENRIDLMPEGRRRCP